VSCGTAERAVYRLDVATGRIAYIQIACGGVGEPARCNPALVNMLPAGDTLVLGWRDTAAFALFDITREVVKRTFVVGGSSTPTASRESNSDD